MTELAVRRAESADLDALAPLFDAYRQFYEQPADLPRARRWLAARMANREAVILVAERQGGAMPGLAGFTQLYPSWCSVAAAPFWILYDLYVDPAARRTGAARALLEAARTLAVAAGVARLELSTARTNAPAQALYESLGWRRDDVFLHYALEIEAP